MRAEVIEQAINVSRELDREIHQLDERFAFLREVIGVAYENLDPDFDRGENWGYLIREMIPFPINPDRRALVPGFALYGEDYFNPRAPLLLFELIQDQEPVGFVLERIMLPIIRHWVACFLKFGYLLEPHGQNVLFELDGENTIRRIVHRDLSVGIDVRRRREIGLSNDQLNSYNLTEHGAFHSITYDKFMGSHFFDPLVTACQEKYPGVLKADFTGPCRDEFARLFPESLEYMPKTVWYFSEERDQYNKPLYHDTEAVPEWRP
jgi:siderophore synthetase component